MVLSLRQKTVKNRREVTLSGIWSSNELLQQKEEPVSKDKNADIRKWFKKKETSNSLLRVQPNIFTLAFLTLEVAEQVA